MNPSDIVERMVDSQPLRQYGDISDETNVFHQRIAFSTWVATEHLKFAFERSQTQDGFERRGFTGAVRPHQADNAPCSDVEIEPI